MAAASTDTAYFLWICSCYKPSFQNSSSSSSSSSNSSRSKDNAEKGSAPHYRICSRFRSGRWLMLACFASKYPLNLQHRCFMLIASPNIVTERALMPLAVKSGLNAPSPPCARLNHLAPLQAKAQAAAPFMQHLRQQLDFFQRLLHRPCKNSDHNLPERNYSTHQHKTYAVCS